MPGEVLDGPAAETAGGGRLPRLLRDGSRHGQEDRLDPETFSVHKGVAYLFSSAEAKAMFDKDPEGTIAKADKAWASLR